MFRKKSGSSHPTTKRLQGLNIKILCVGFFYLYIDFMCLKCKYLMSVDQSYGCVCLHVYMCDFMNTCNCVNGVFMNVCFVYEFITFPTAQSCLSLSPLQLEIIEVKPFCILISLGSINTVRNLFRKTARQQLKYLQPQWKWKKKRL